MPDHPQEKSTDISAPPALAPQPDEMQTILPGRVEWLPASNEEQQTILPGRLTNTDPVNPPAEQDSAFPPIPGYRILKELGKGGMGIVFLAEQTKLHRMVALKMIRGGFVERQEQRQRFLIEAEAVARLQHPNIVQIFEIGDILQPDGSSSPFMALEYVAGKSLEDHLQGKPMAARTAAELIVQLARAMQYAHDLHLIHRDLKPANILLAPQDDRHSKSLSTESVSRYSRSNSLLAFIPKITDFGLAKQIDMNSSQTKAGEIMGTPSYMAPEQAAAKTDIGPSVDTYALGAILYELLTGRPPFRSFTTLDTILQVLEDEPVPPSKLQTQIPRDVETICLKCLAKLPAKRYGSSSELADDLERYLKDEPILARPANVAERLWKWAKRRPTAAALLLVSLLGLITFIAGIVYFNQMVRDERDIALDAKKDAQLQRDDARKAKLQADAKASETQRTLDFFAVTTGLQQIENHELYRGLLWCAKPLQELGPYRQPDALFRDRLGFYLHFANRPTLQQMFFARGFINHGVFSPDDRWIALASSDQAVQVYDAATGLAVSPNLKGVGREWLSFSPDGRYLLTVNGTRASLFNTKDWQPHGQPMVHGASIKSVRFSPDGKQIATASLDKTVRLWSAENGQPIGQPIMHTQPVNDVAFRNDGKVIATVTGKTDDKGQLRLWNVESGQQIGETITFPDYAVVVAFSPKGDIVAAASFDGTVQLYDGNTAAPKRVKMKVGMAPRQLLFDPTGTKLATASQDWFVPVFDVETGRQLQQLPHELNVWGLAYNRDGTTLITYGEDMTLRVWDTSTGKLRQPHIRHRGTVTHAALSSTGKQLLSCSDDGSARLWHLDSRRSPAIELNQTAWVWVVAVPQDESIIATGGDDKLVRFWNIKDGKPQGEPLKFPNLVRDMVFHPQSKQIAVCGMHNEALVWDYATRQPVCQPLKHAQRVTSVRYSPDGQWILTASLDGLAKIWSSSTGELVKSLEHSAPLTSGIFDHSGTLVLTTSVQGTVTLWDRGSGKHRFPPWKHGRNEISKAAFSPDDMYAATASHDYSTRLWNLSTGEAVQSPMLHQYESIWLDFHPTSKRLVTASFDMTARLWDTETAQSVGSPMKHLSWVMNAKFSLDGQWVSTCSRDRTARLWDSETGQAISPPLPHEGRVVSQWMSRDQRMLVTGALDSKGRIWKIPKETRPTDDLVSLIELYDGHQLNKLGGLKQLSNSEMEQSWKKLKEKYPEEFKLHDSK